MSRPLKTHAEHPDRTDWPMCVRLTARKVDGHGHVVGALNATCLDCQHLLRIAALTPTTKDTMSQKHIDTAVETVIIHIAKTVAMRVHPGLLRHEAAQQKRHVAASLDLLIVETSHIDGSVLRRTLDSAVEKFWPELQPPVLLVPCCMRDADRDGNCDHHPHGVVAVEPKKP